MVVIDQICELRIKDKADTQAYNRMNLQLKGSNKIFTIVMIIFKTVISTLLVF